MHKVYSLESSNLKPLTINPWKPAGLSNPIQQRQFNPTEISFSRRRKESLSFLKVFDPAIHQFPFRFWFSYGYLTNLIDILQSTEQYDRYCKRQFVSRTNCVVLGDQ